MLQLNRFALLYLNWSSKIKRELDFKKLHPASDATLVTYAKKIKTDAKHRGLKQIQTRWEENTLYGKYASLIKEAVVDMKVANKKLKSCRLQVKSEGLL